MINNPTEECLRTLSGIVYLIINKINDMKYVGISTNTFFIRYRTLEWWKHTSNDYIKNSVAKYGQENFEIIILEDSIKDTKTLENLEKMYIAFYNSLKPHGYNLTTGGNQSFIRDADSIIKKLKTEGRYRNHVLLDKDGNRYEFDNIARFSREHDIPRTHLKSVINGKRRSTRGFHLEGVDVRTRKWKNGQIHYVKDRDNNIYEICNIKEFAEKHGVCKNSLLRLVKRKNFHCGLKFYNIDTDINLMGFEKSKYKMIKLEKDGKIYTIYNQNEFCKENNIKKESFLGFLKGRCKAIYGFKLISYELH
jgi:hypothetical protein